MYCIRNITDDIVYVGVNDNRTRLFENIHHLRGGVSYNSYVIRDEQNVLVDTCDRSVASEFLDNIAGALCGGKLDAIIVNHAEPDHASTLGEVLLKYPEAKVYCTAKAIMMLTQFGIDVAERATAVGEGDTVSFGKHEVEFHTAPMVHWPEVMVSFDKTDGVLFSADAFGSFGALNGKVFEDEFDFDHDILDEMRRYYCNIVGKYGPQVQMLLKKLGGLSIRMIAPLHGPVWRSNIETLIVYYDKWSRYEPEKKGVMIAFASMYGDTENAAQIFASKLCQAGITDYVMCDVSKTDLSELIAYSFKYSTLALFSVTYNLKVFPLMAQYLEDMAALGLQKRSAVVFENGTWAPQAGGLIVKALEEMKSMTVLGDVSTVLSSVSSGNVEQIDAAVKAVVDEIGE